MTVTPEVLEPTGSDDVAVAEPRPRRHVWRWIILAIVLIVVAGGTAFIVKASTKNVVGWNGGLVGARGSGMIQHKDPFGAEPGGEWAEIKYQPGATLTLEFSIANLSHTQTITIRSISFDGVANPDGSEESPISKAAVAADYDFRGGDSSLQPFHPFRLPPGDQAVVELMLTMCPTGTPSNGVDSEFSSFDIDYSYFGFHRHQTLPLVQPLQVDNVSYCA